LELGLQSIMALRVPLSVRGIKMNRRNILSGFGHGLLFATSPLAVRQALALEDEARNRPNVVFNPNKPIPFLADYARQIASLKGGKNPYPQEIETGNKLVNDIPSGPKTKPHDVAYRFHQWRKKEVGSTDKEKKLYSYYAREWPERGNPLIMQFFDATSLRNPKGDTTYWSSAFVSWCIGRTQKDGIDTKPRVWPYEDGAASASYRSWGQSVSDPRKGDLAVFRRRDTDWAGHIGFVNRIDGDWIWVLGGNQGAQDEYNGGEVNIARFAREGGSLVLHSFRRHEVLA
jgi:uncharacterized protein (TIGR02594 family)